MVKKSIFGLLFLFLAYFLLLAFGNSIARFNDYVTPILSIILAIGLVFCYKYIKLDFNKWLYIAVLSLTVIVPRLLWIITVDITPISDFGVYYELAKQFAEGTFAGSDYAAMIPHVLGYPFVLSWFFRLFGVSVPVAQIFNIICILISSLLLWRILATFISDRMARFAAILFAIIPSAIFYSSIVSTESLFTMQILLAVYFFVKALKLEGLRDILFLALSVLILVWANSVRPIAMVILIAEAIYILFQMRDGRIFKLISIVMMIALFALGSKAVGMVQARVLGVPMVVNSMGDTIYKGANIEHHGMWNPEDSAEFVHVYENFPHEDLNKIMLQKTWDRIAENPMASAMHYLTKCAIIWASDGYGVDWNRISVEVEGGDYNAEFEVFNERLSNIFYQAMLLLAALGAILAIRRGKFDGILFAVIFLGFVGIFIISEVQGRYHYPALPFLIGLAAMGIGELARIKNTELR